MDEGMYAKVHPEKKNRSIDSLGLVSKIQIVPNAQNQLQQCFENSPHALCYLAPHLHFLQSLHLVLSSPFHFVRFILDFPF